MHSNRERRGAAVRATKPTLFAISLCAATGSIAPLFAQNAGRLPTVDEVLERHVEATGGRETLLRHTSMTVHGRYQDPAHKADYETVFYTKDGKMLLKADLGGGKQYQTGYDGETAWVLHPDGKVDIAEGDVVKTVARDADMYYHLHVLNYFKSMEVVDVKEFNGRPCYHLKGINNWGKVNEQFYDKENGLLMGYAFNTAWRGGRGDATDTFEEYREFGGVRMAAKTTSRDGDDLTISLITAVTYDDVKDDMFAVPTAVKVAVAEKKGHIPLSLPAQQVHAAIEQAYARLDSAISHNDVAGILALEAPDYSSVNPTGAVFNRAAMEKYVSQLAAAIDSVILIRNLIRSFSTHGDTAVADVCQEFSRIQRIFDGKPHRVDTSALQRETWIHRMDGWKRLRVANVHGRRWFVDGVRVNPSGNYHIGMPPYRPTVDPPTQCGLL